MRIYDSAIAAQLSARAGLDARHLMWIEARNRDTGDMESIGIWDGDDHLDFVIGGVTRTYLGAGGLLSVPDLTMRVGLDIWQPEVQVSAITPEVEQALRGYDPKLAPVEIHRAFFDPVEATLLAPPVRIFKGWIDGVSIPTPEEGGEAVATITLASNSRSLTRKLHALRSDAAYQMRGGDRINRYTDVVGQIKTRWGS